MDTTPRKRTKILTLYEHATKIQSEIAKIMGVNQSTVSQILKQARETGSHCQTEREDVGERGRLQREILLNCYDIVKKIQERPATSSGKNYSHLKRM